MKTYNPPEYNCALCGQLIITRNPKEYVYKQLDNRASSPTYRKTLFFCSNSCYQKFEKTYPRRKKYGGG